MRSCNDSYCAFLSKRESTIAGSTRATPNGSFKNYLKNGSIATNCKKKKCKYPLMKKSKDFEISLKKFLKMRFYLGGNK